VITARLNPYLLLTLTALFWSGNMVVGRAVREEVAPFALAMGRWLIVFVLITPFVWREIRPSLPLIWAHMRIMLILGVLGVGAYNTFAYLALQQTTATNASLLNSFIPVATVGFAWLLMGRKLGLREATGMAVSLLGVLVIVGKGDWQTLLGFSLNQGDLWMLAAVLVWGLYTVLLHRRPGALSPLVFLWALTVIGILALFPFFIWEWSFSHPLSLSVSASLAWLYIGIFPGFLGYVFYNAGVAAVGPAKASLFIHLMPVFGSLLAALFLDERLLAFHLVGITLVFAGIALVMFQSTPMIGQNRSKDG
jgi:drug/metabolite transporter (DMT)-like permease